MKVKIIRNQNIITEKVIEIPDGPLPEFDDPSIQTAFWSDHGWETTRDNTHGHIETVTDSGAVVGKF